MCSLCCLCTYPATPISNRPPAMCGQHEPPVRPAAPRFESRRCDLCQSWGEDEPDSLRYLKVANRSFSVAEGSPARCAASAKRAETSYRGIPKGAALGAPLVTFSATGKSPGGEGRSALPIGVVGAQPPLGWSAEEGVSPPRIRRQAAAKKSEATFRFCPHIIRKRKSLCTQNAKRSDLP